MPDVEIPRQHLADVEILWDYLQMHHELQPADVGIGLGSHDPTVPEVTVDLFEHGMFPYIVFTGANAPTTIERYPRGEAVHYGEFAVQRGVPTELVLLENSARHTAENFTLTRKLLERKGHHPTTAIVTSRPYQQRRAFSIAAKVWPDLTIMCASTQLSLVDYVRLIGDVDLVINMMVGDAYRLTTDVTAGISIPQEVPDDVTQAQHQLADAGYTRRVPNPGSTA
jgi:hypothetical protein